MSTETYHYITLPLTRTNISLSIPKSEVAKLRDDQPGSTMAKNRAGSASQEQDVIRHFVKIRVIDTPGLAFAAPTEPVQTEETRARDILLRSRGRVDRLKEPVPVGESLQLRLRSYVINLWLFQLPRS